MELTDLASELIALASGWLAAGFLGAGRLVAFTQVFVLFSTFQFSPFLRMLIALAMSLPLIVAIHGQGGGPPALDGSLLVPIAKELTAGLILGLFLSIPFYAAQAAGDFVDTYRGASQANFVTPGNAEETSESGQTLLFFFMAIYIVEGGLPVTLQLIYQSYSVVPADAFLPLDFETLVTFLSALFTSIFSLGLMMGGPLLIALATVDIFFVLMSRSAKNLNLFDLSVAFKNVVLVIALPVYITFLAIYASDTWRRVAEDTSAFLRGN
ncbi:MAG: flagellar biosynthetic protein FliR [Hyphomicrobiaceae bacterium]|nr:flagellar biosynthetic protein FliR [Hyphomicrobiaceae bacterium]